MIELLLVVLPVFLVIGFGYVVTWRGMFPESASDALMVFAQKFALPCLLFRAISTMDLGQNFDPALLGGFYAGAFLCFLAGIFGARLIFGRPWEDSVVIGFACFFSNTLLLGLPITERAYGAEALAANYAIISIHAPIAYGISITVMEIVMARGQSAGAVARTAFMATFSNALIVGILLGFAVNIGQLPMPTVLSEAVDLMARAALPVALFALGGVLYRYKPEGDLRTIAFMCSVSLVLHPSLVWIFGGMSSLGTDALRSSIVTSAMPPGINAYIFASMYGVAKRVVASTVLIGTALTVISASVWLALLP